MRVKDVQERSASMTRFSEASSFEVIAKHFQSDELLLDCFDRNAALQNAFFLSKQDVCLHWRLGQVDGL